MREIIKTKLFRKALKGAIERGEAKLIAFEEDRNAGYNSSSIYTLDGEVFLVSYTGNGYGEGHSDYFCLQAADLVERIEQGMKILC